MNFIAIEKLEGRQLFATGPAAVLRISPRHPSFGTATLQLVVTFTDPAGMDPTSFDVRDIRVAGPNNFARYARPTTSTSNADGTQRVVRYKMPPPGGFWNAADNGAYTVRLHGNSVFNINGVPADSQLLGKFSVDIAQPRAVTHAVSHPFSDTSIRHHPDRDVLPE